MRRPKTRGDCLRGPRPCPWATCKWHAIHVQSTDHLSKKRVSSDFSCVLDAIDANPCGMRLDDIAAMTGTTRQCVSQTINATLRKLDRCDSILYQIKIEGTRA